MVQALITGLSSLARGETFFLLKSWGSSVGRRGGASPLWRVLATWVLALRSQLAVPW